MDMLHDCHYGIFLLYHVGNSSHPPPVLDLLLTRSQVYLFLGLFIYFIYLFILYGEHSPIILKERMHENLGGFGSTKKTILVSDLIDTLAGYRILDLK